MRALSFFVFWKFLSFCYSEPLVTPLSNDIPVDLASQPPLTVFQVVWKCFPAKITAISGENYIYWNFEGTGLRGNLRLARRDRHLGVLHLGYQQTSPPASGHAVFGMADGVQVVQQACHKFTVTFQQKTVEFHLPQISQIPPAWLLGNLEMEFIQRTLDESGTQFLLCRHRQRNAFLWFRDEEAAAEALCPLSPASPLLVGRESGFVFAPWGPQGRQRWLVAVRKSQLTENREFDGPFDQLADNYMHLAPVLPAIESVYPSLHGMLDDYGYYKGVYPEKRVALKNYGTYESYSTLEKMWLALEIRDQIDKMTTWFHQK